MADHNLGCCKGLTGNRKDMHAKGKARPDFQKEPDKDKAVSHPSCSVIDAMSSEITKEDIAILVFHWTTVDKFDAYQRV